MLDWDKPLSEQPEAVRKAIADAQSIGMFKNIDDRATGAQIYNASIGESGGGQRGEEASRMLREMGIPGIKYLDQVSRGAGEGTRNFVVFPGNEDLLRIIERNNEKLPESSPGYAEGGAVQTYAQGGIVRSEFEYDPAAVDARAAALMEEIDAA